MSASRPLHVPWLRYIDIRRHSSIHPVLNTFDTRYLHYQVHPWVIALTQPVSKALKSFIRSLRIRGPLEPHNWWASPLLHRNDPAALLSWTPNFDEICLLYGISGDMSTTYYALVIHITKQFRVRLIFSSKWEKMIRLFVPSAAYFCLNTI